MLLAQGRLPSQLTRVRAASRQASKAASLGNGRGSSRNLLEMVAWHCLVVGPDWAKVSQGTGCTGGDSKRLGSSGRKRIRGGLVVHLGRLGPLLVGCLLAFRNVFVPRCVPIGWPLARPASRAASGRLLPGGSVRGSARRPRRGCRGVGRLARINRSRSHSLDLLSRGWHALLLRGLTEGFLAVDHGRLAERTLAVGHGRWVSGHASGHALGQGRRGDASNLSRVAKMWVGLNERVPFRRAGGRHDHFHGSVHLLPVVIHLSFHGSVHVLVHVLTLTYLLADLLIHGSLHRVIHVLLNGPALLNVHAVVVVMSLNALGRDRKLQLDLEGLTIAATKHSEQVFRDASGDHLGLLSHHVTTQGLKGPGEHALANQGRVALGVVDGIDGVVAVLAGELRAASYDSVEARSQVDDADGNRLVDGDRLHVQRVRVSGEAVDLGVLVERVVDLDCSRRVSRSKTAQGSGKEAYGPWA